ncbi:hypothetical protein MASR1M107_07640 [Ignavibacteriales bacterium]
MKSFITTLLVALTILITGCDKKTATIPSTKDSTSIIATQDSNHAELRNLFNMQVQALKGKNVNEYMKTMKVTGLDSINTHNQFETLTKLYDLDYTILNFSVIRADSRSAEVEIEMEVRKVNGPRFDDHRSVTRHILEFDGEKWQIVQSSELKFTKLAEEPKK